MNNKGFTLIEVLGVFVIISFITLIVFHNISKTMSIGQNEGYKLMKNNIISAGYNYINECNQGIVECEYSPKSEYTFPAKILHDKGYFQNLESPIDKTDLGECLILTAKKENGVLIIDLIDNCY